MNKFQPNFSRHLVAVINPLEGVKQAPPCGIVTLWKAPRKASWVIGLDMRR